MLDDLVLQFRRSYLELSCFEPMFDLDRNICLDITFGILFQSNTAWDQCSNRLS